MKQRVTIELPLSGMTPRGVVKTDTFKVKPPCFYCGSPVAESGDHIYHLTGDYKIQRWGLKRDTVKPILGDLIDRHGNMIKGHYAIHLPYCTKHIQPIKTFKIINIMSIILGAAFGLGLTAFLSSYGMLGGFVYLSLVTSPFFFAVVFYWMGAAIKALLVRVNAKLQDYPLRNGHYGICTHGVRVDGGKPMQGPITYYLKVACCNLERAIRLQESIPQAKIIE